MTIAQLEEIKSQIPDSTRPIQEFLPFGQRVQQILLNAFNTMPEMISLSKEERSALANYLYVNYLIIQCKQASVRVSPTTWEGIEARMLLVPSS